MNKSLEDTKIGLATAKLAKEKHYDAISKGSITEYITTQIDPEYPDGGGSFGWKAGELEGSYDYFRNNDAGSDYSNKNYIMYARPTQTVLAKWLREKHGLILCVTYTNITGIKWGYDIYGRGTIYAGNSYEECLELGLVEALKLIII